MRLALTPKTSRIIEHELRTGRYSSAEAVVQAALMALKQQATFGDFAPGELDQLLREGERSIRQEGTVPADEVFSELRRRSQKRRRARKAG